MSGQASDTGGLQPLRRRAANILERIFGPDPGLTRVFSAMRGIASAATCVGIVILLFGATPKQAPMFAVAFMLGIFGNVALRDKGRGSQAVTLVLMALCMVTTITVVGMLHPLGWPADVAVVLVATAGTYAQSLGPRYIALSIVSFMGAFLGAILHPPLALLPPLLAVAATSIAITMLLRFVVFPIDPAHELSRVRAHLLRRVGRIVDLVHRIVSEEEVPQDLDSDHRLVRRAHSEIGRLNDAFLVAQNTLKDRSGDPDAGDPLSWDNFFALEQAAERLLRVAVLYTDRARREAALEELARLDEAIRRGEPGELAIPPANPDDRLASAVRGLEQAVRNAARREVPA